MKTKRILATCLVLAMLVTFIPVFTFGASAATVTTVETSTKENSNQASGVVYTKTSTAKDDGTVDITLTAHTTGEVKQLSAVSPTDIVLVLDVSGSMAETYTTSKLTGYDAVTGGEYTYTVWYFIIPVDYTGYGLENTDENYYINTGSASEPIYTRVTYTGRDANGFEMYEYSNGTTEVVVYPALNGVSAARQHSYDVVQFYSANIESKTERKMTSLQNAVKSFIDTAKQMNNGLAVEDMHNISIVKFANDSYYNSSVPTVIKGNHKGADNNSNYNYSEVVEDLTPVDEAGAEALNAAVDSLEPGGATAVDYGLNLAEAVLMNRSEVTHENAVDRKEVVIVFTDGEPTYSSGFSNTVANNAISIAGNMEKTADVTVYGVCIDSAADETDLTQNINKFMHYMTSNFPNAANMNSAGSDGSIDNGYYMTPHGNMTLTMIFESIIQEIDHPTVTMGEEATMIDTLSPYFDFKNGSAADVKLQTSLRNADGTWATPVDDGNLTYNITEDRLTVNGFDFDANYVSETGRGDNKDFYGKRLVVTFTVIPDYDVIDAASATLMDGILPTNSGFASLIDSDSAPAAEVETPVLNAHQVVYKVDGEEYASYNRFNGSEITVDAEPTKEGYTFSGWSTTDVSVSNGTFEMPYNDVEFVGTFTPIPYTVTYQYSTQAPAGAPNPPAGRTAYIGDTVTIAAAPEFQGYVFKGWYPLQTDVKPEDGKFTMPAKDVTLVGYFENSTATPYKFEHYMETLTDGVYEEKAELTEDFYGTTDNTVTAIPLNRFTGFKYNAAKSADTISGKIKGDGSLVLKLYYDREEYTVTYGYDGDTQIAGLPTLPAGGTYKYGETVNVAAKAIAPEGYSFTGWYRGTVDSPVEGSFTMPAYSVHLLGFFSPDTATKYMVEHYLMDTEGKYPENPETTETLYGTTGNDVTANPLTTFEGFTYNSSKSTASGKIAGDGSLVLKLYYDRIKYKVTYEYERTIPADATALPSEASYYHGESVDMAADATAKGYTFSGWHIHDETVDKNNDSFIMPTRDVKVYGYFTANTDTPYKVEHYLEKLDGSGYEDDPYITQKLTGTTGEEVTAASIAIAGFTYKPDVSKASGTISGDGLLVLKLYYDRNEYKVTYEYEGNIPTGFSPVLPAEETYVYGETVTVANKSAVPADYTFVGWYRGETTNIVAEFTMPDRDVVLRGYFKPNDNTEYKVEHYLMNTAGEYPATPETTETLYGTAGNNVTASPLTIFEGFTYNANESTASGTIASGLVLKLYYDRTKYKVTYEYERTIPADATALPSEAFYYHGESVDMAADATAKGYTFSGWHIHDETVDKTNDSFIMPKRDVKVYGYFTANTDTPYKVEHYVEKLVGSGYEDDPYITQNLTGTTGEEVTAASIAIAGFEYNSAASTASGTISGDGLLVLKLYYTRNLRNVRYEYEGDLPANIPTLPPLETFRYGTTVNVADKVTAPVGYTFVGWYRGEVTNIVTSFEMPDRDVVLRGYFKPGESTPYTIHHYLETLTDGIYEQNPVLVESDFSGTTGHTVHATPLNRFTGFKYNEEKSENTISGQILGDGSLVLKVYYDREQYDVTYGYEGDIPDNAPALPTGGRYAYGARVPVAAQVTAPAGYTFVGWYRGTEENHVSGTFEMPNFNVNLLGNFEEKTNTPYRVEHYLQKVDGTGYDLDSGETRHGTTDATVSALAKEYPGFDYRQDLSTTEGKIKGDGSLVLKFFYDRNTYNVEYVYNGIVPDDAPSAPASVSGKRYGEEITVADTPSIPGYTFDGWKTADASIDNGKITMPDKNVVFTGSFASNEVDYKVNYWLQKTDAGNTFNKADYELDTQASYTKKAFTAQHVEAENKKYTGFSVNEAESNSFGHVTVDDNGAGNLVLNIYYDRHTYNVTYGYYGEQPAGVPDLTDRNKTNVRYGTTVDIAAIPEFADYSFDGWYTRTADVEDGKFVMPDHNVDFLGRFVKQYNVVYDLNGGTGAEGVDYSGKAVNAEENITVNAAPVREGYTFRGWMETETVYNPGDTVKVEKNLLFVAQWSRNGGGGGGGGSVKYTLTYETNGGTEIKSEKYNKGTVVQINKKSEKEGYILEGWYLDKELTEFVDEVKMDKNITVYAKWVEDNGSAGSGYNTPGSLNNEDHFAYVVGYPDGMVKPNANITRAEVTEIFFRLLKPDELRDNNLTKDNNFKDVESSAWYNTSVSTMAKLGIIKGRTIDTFVPNANITRAEFAAICARFDNSEYEITDNFTDVQGHWAEADIHEAAAHGWIRGYEDGTFRPDRFITRAEAMTMINRVLNRVPEKPGDLLDDMIKWPDNSDTSAWYYLAVQEATNSHDFEMKNHIYERWTAIKEGTDWMKYQR